MIEYFVKKPMTVAMVLWTGDNLAEVRDFCGTTSASGEPAFRVGDDGAWVWNAQEDCWIAVPVGHRVVLSTLGELYPVSPEAIARTFEPADGPQ